MSSSTPLEIREVTLDDTAALLSLKRRLDRESDFMMLEPDERATTEEEERGHIADVLVRNNSTILVADAGSELAGYLEASGGMYRRNRHVVEIVVGVRGGYIGRGIGTRFFERLDAWARSAGIRRLELTVMRNNHRALRLYERAGFEVEGIRRDSLRIDGHYIDEYAMARLLNHTPAAEDSSRSGG